MKKNRNKTNFIMPELARAFVLERGSVSKKYIGAFVESSMKKNFPFDLCNCVLDYKVLKKKIYAYISLKSIIESHKSERLLSPVTLVLNSQKKYVDRMNIILFKFWIWIVIRDKSGNVTEKCNPIGNCIQFVDSEISSCKYKINFYYSADSSEVYQKYISRYAEKNIPIESLAEKWSSRKSMLFKKKNNNRHIVWKLFSLLMVSVFSFCYILYVKKSDNSSSIINPDHKVKVENTETVAEKKISRYSYYDLFFTLGAFDENMFLKNLTITDDNYHAEYILPGSLEWLKKINASKLLAENRIEKSRFNSTGDEIFSLKGKIKLSSRIDSVYGFLTEKDIAEIITKFKSYGFLAKSFNTGLTKNDKCNLLSFTVEGSPAKLRKIFYEESQFFGSWKICKVSLSSHRNSSDSYLIDFSFAREKDPVEIIEIYNKEKKSDPIKIMNLNKNNRPVHEVPVLCAYVGRVYDNMNTNMYVKFNDGKIVLLNDVKKIGEKYESIYKGKVINIEGVEDD